MVPKRFARVHVGNVHFYHGRHYRRDSIANSHRRMRISSSVEHDTSLRKADLVYFVNSGAFTVALEIIEFHRGEARLQLLEVRGKVPRVVNARFALAQQVQVRSGDNGDFFHGDLVSNKSNSI